MSQKESGKTVTSPSKTYEQQMTLKDLLGAYSPTIGQGQQYPSFETVAPFTSGQASALASLEPYASSMPLWGNMQNTATGLLSGTTGAQPYTPQMAESAFKSIYEQPAMKYWGETLQPAIRESFAGPGFNSSARARAEMEGAQDLGDWLGQTRGQFMWDVEGMNRQIEEAKAGRALSALGISPSISQAPLSYYGNAFSALSPAQQQQQNEIYAEIERFAADNRITDPENLSILMQLLGLGGFSTQTQRVYNTPSEFQQGMNWAGLGGTALTGYSTGAAGGGGFLGGLGGIGSAFGF